MKAFSVSIILTVLLSGLSPFISAQILDSPRDGVFDKIHLQEKKPIPYAPIREADVMWEKRIWRIIDLRQKINHPFYYPEVAQKNWRNFMTVVMDAVREGTLTAYDASKDDQFLVPMTYQEIEKKYKKTDTVPVYDPENPEKILEWNIVQEDFNSTFVKQIKLKEDWFFDKQRSQMDVRILGICPMYDMYDENDNFLGREPMFWLYFPEARPVFAQSIVFNRSNGAEDRTYDELFWKRMFGSYIIKEENVFDRDINKYATQMDALLEAERIKNELFEYEHELWEF